MTRPSIGRVVHFVLASGEHRAATVVNAWPDEMAANLTVHLDVHRDLMFQVDFTSPDRPTTPPALKPSVRGEQIGGTYFGSDTLHVSGIRYDPSGAPATWHWPERED